MKIKIYGGPFVPSGGQIVKMTYSDYDKLMNRLASQSKALEMAEKALSSINQNYNDPRVIQIALSCIRSLRTPAPSEE